MFSWDNSGITMSGQDMRGDADKDGILAVIPCLNEEANIAAVISSALQDRERFHLLIIVADGGSSDRTRTIVNEIAASAPQVRLMDNPRKIQSAGVNRAVAEFGHGKRWLVRMDAHCGYPDGYISGLADEARRTGASSVVVAMNACGKSLFQKAAATAQNTLLGTGGAAHRMKGESGFVDHGHHALFEMDAFRAAGGYDEHLSHNEDAEFDLRLRRNGGRIWLTRAFAIDYFPRGRVGDLFRQYLNYGRGRATTTLLHRARPKLRQLLPAAVAPAAALLLAAPWYPIAAFPVLLWLGVCLAYGGILALRARSFDAAVSGPAAIVMHAGWSIGFWRGLLQAFQPRAGIHDIQT